MGKTTGIAWCDATWNAWWGCTKISPGCTNCYADTWATRWKYDVWGPKAGRRFFDEKGPRVYDNHWREPLNWNRAAEKAGKRLKVFCGSMMDWAEARPDLPQMDVARAKLFDVIEITPWLDWLMLTKRPENILGMIPDHWRENPRPNVWMGTTTENQAEADKRIPALLAVPAVLHFLSAEPLLGPVKLPTRMEWQDDAAWANNARPYTYLGVSNEPDAQIDWLIIGGESGPGHRHMEVSDAIDLKRQADAATGTAVFFKQGSEDWGPDFKHVESFPPELQVQNFPTRHLARTSLKLPEAV